MHTRDDALTLLYELTKSESLRKHGLAVEASMRAFARRLGGDEETWGIVGLLHDFDYEAHPGLDEHPFFGARILTEAGWSREIIDGVLAHAPYTGVQRDTPLKQTIFAVDELSGFIVACALVHGRSFGNLDPARVRKKLKDKSFARQVNRDDIRVGLEELGGDPDEHIQFVINALKAIAPELGLAAEPSGI
ncbi:MAG: HDIG domain-containing metalloprotein [Chloroflexota bacterium]